MNDEHQWPKRLSASNYAKRWDADLCARTIINRVKANKLPGGQDEGGRWFVWVHSDYTPAWNYQGPEFAPTPIPSKAQSIADNILGEYRKAG
jgi:hypothetical protein